MSSNTPSEQTTTIILIVTAIVSVIIGFASGSVGTAIGSFMGILLLFGIIGSQIQK